MRTGRRPFSRRPEMNGTLWEERQENGCRYEDTSWKLLQPGEEEAAGRAAVSACPPGFPRPPSASGRQQVLGLYRRILRAVRQIPDPADRSYMKDWARGEFRQNQSTTDETTIRMMIMQGQQQVKELERALQLAKS
ncbi:LYR motif-containing protein 2-like isoform X1 [Hyperolius riggenbachi]|uniref:LYR motif-containing protein 2-like isoform X1 n=1 Tax=Hyperolius riggenbachi TaxID=752182 RepID=UPI0035A3CF7A